jgi:hypothetical protein
MTDEEEYWKTMALRYREMNKELYQIAEGWRASAMEYKELYEQVIVLTGHKQGIAAALPVGGEA